MRADRRPYRGLSRTAFPDLPQVIELTVRALLRAKPVGPSGLQTAMCDLASRSRPV
jgi:hypothetical protein